MKIFISVLAILLAAMNVMAQSNGRYQITYSPHGARDTFLLDTQQGRVWVLVESDGGNAFQRIVVEQDESFESRQSAASKEEIKKYLELEREKLRKTLSSHQERLNDLRKAFDYSSETKAITGYRTAKEVTATQWFQLVLLSKFKETKFPVTDQESAYLKQFSALLKKSPQSEYPLYTAAREKFDSEFVGAGE